MSYVSTYEAKKNLSALLKRVQKGETVIISNHNQPIAELRATAPLKSKKKRPFGLCKGQFRVPENFNDPLPESFLSLFEKKIQS